MLIIKGDKNIVTVTRVYIASPEGANGRNVVAYGMLNALTSKYKTMVFRPAVSNHDEFTPILLAASNAGLGVALSTGLDVHKVREDKDTARGDIVGAFNDAMDVSRADAALIVGTDKSHVNDPTSYEFDANVAADLKAGVFLAVCTIDRWPHELDETVKLSIEGMEAAGNKVLGIFVTGCEPRHAFSVKETLAKYGLPVWTLPQVPFTDESTKDLALETFRKNAPTDEVLAALDVDVTAPITPYAFQFGLLGKAKSNKKTIVLPEGEEDRIIKAADYLLEREIVNLIIEGTKGAIRIDMCNVGMTVKLADGTEEHYCVHANKEIDDDRTRIYHSTEMDGAIQYGHPGKKPPMWLNSIMNAEMEFFNGVMHGDPIPDEFKPLMTGEAARAAIATADAATLSLRENRKVSVEEVMK